MSQSASFFWRKKLKTSMVAMMDLKGDPYIRGVIDYYADRDHLLTDLITGTDSILTRLPMASHKPKPWEPEPFRSLGVNLMRQTHYLENEEVERTGIYPKWPETVRRAIDL